MIKFLNDEKAKHVVLPRSIIEINYNPANEGSAGAFNPTIENIAYVIKQEAEMFAIRKGLRFENVRIHESDTGWVDLFTDSCCG